MPNICDYEGSDYQKRFWGNADRTYEDAVERAALKRLLPATGSRLIEFGAGFGRLAELYAGYREVVLFDYSRSLLEEARQRWGSDDRFKFVVGNLYELPFAPGIFDSATMIRVIHHISDVPKALAQIRNTLHPGATFIMEFANKRNLKAMVRHAFGSNGWSPYADAPVEFATLNFDFHPRWMIQQLRAAHFEVTKTVPLSHLRSRALKRTLPVGAMIAVDGALQRVPLLISPSVFSVNRVPGLRTAVTFEVPFEASLRAPVSGAPLRREGNFLLSDADGTRWHADGNLYNLKEAV